MSEFAKDTRHYRRRWWILGVLAVSVLIVVIDATIINIALPTLQRELGTTMSELQWIINSYIMIFGALMLTMGSLGDRWGRARILNLGVFVFAAGSLGAAFSGSGLQLILWRALMGVGGAMIQARIETLIYGAADPKAGAVHSCFRIEDALFLNHSIQVVSGILEDECGSILKDFFRTRRNPSD